MEPNLVNTRISGFANPDIAALSKPRVAICARVSTGRQEEEETIDTQLMVIGERIERDGLDYPDERFIYVDDGWTGATLNRPGIDKMMEDARSRLFDVVYFYDIGRIARKVPMQRKILDELRELGIKRVSIRETIEDTDTGVFNQTVMGAVHELERTTIITRFSDGKRKKVQLRKKLLGYNPLFGYDYHPIIRAIGYQQEAHFTINEEEAEIVRLIFDLVGNKGMCVFGVVAELARRGILAPKGGKYWQNSTIHRMLRNTSYYGEHYYNKGEAVEPKNPKKIEKYKRIIKSSRRYRDKKDWWMVEIPAIIDKELFYRAVTLLDKNSVNTRNNTVNQYLLTGLMWCACGMRRAGDPGSYYTYYRCLNRLNRFNGARTCFEKGVRSDLLDNEVWKRIKKLLTPKMIRKLVEKRLAGRNPLESEIEILEKRLAAIATEKERYLKLYGDGKITESEFDKARDPLREEETKKTAEINTLKVNLKHNPQLSINELVKNSLRIDRNLDFDAKKAVLQKIVKKIVTTKDSVSITGAIPVFENIFTLEPAMVKVGGYANNEHSCHINQHSGYDYTRLSASSVNCYGIGDPIDYIPFRITFALPKNKKAKPVGLVDEHGRKVYKIKRKKLIDYCKSNPFATHAQAAVHFKCSDTAIIKAKRKYGISHKTRRGRPVTPNF
jgi:site-specific DNA recombinase